MALWLTSNDNKFMLKLPGFSLKVIKYVGDKTHCLRYVFKNRQTGDMYFNVNFTLLWGDELQNALKEDGNELGEAQTVHDTTTPPANSNVDVLEQEKPPSDTSSQRVAVGGASIDSAPSSTAPLDMQLHPGDHHALAESISNDADRQEDVGMQLHPGDHNAAAQSFSSNIDSSVDEISRLLQQTSTNQQTGGRFLEGIN